MMSRKTETEIVSGEFARPEAGVIWRPLIPVQALPASELPGWQSNGGNFRGHSDRNLPFSLDIRLPDGAPILRMFLVGIFALHAQKEVEGFGTIGASIQ